MKIHEILKIRKQSGSKIGIEIECEGVRLPEAVPGAFWKVVPDGSLRDGLEYVYVSPQDYQELEASLDELTDAFDNNKAKPNFSFRTSVHVHVNCLDMEYQHVLNYMYTYFLLEKVLVDFCGEHRKGNRFCLRMEDAEGVLDYVLTLFRSRASRNTLGTISAEQTRYAAMNISSLNKFGTLEFRAMRGTLDKDVIVPWVNVLIGIREFACKFSSTKDILALLDDVGEYQFFKEVLGDYHELFDNGSVIENIRMGSSLTVDLPYSERDRSKDKVRDITKFPKDKVFKVYGSNATVERIIKHFGADNIPDEVWDEIEASLDEEAEPEVPVDELAPQPAGHRPVRFDMFVRDDPEMDEMARPIEEIFDEDFEEDDEW